MVKVQCEIKDYTDMKVDNPNVIVKSAWPDDDMVCITIGDKTAKLHGQELSSAIARCTHTESRFG